MGMAANTHPAVILLADNLNAPRSLMKAIKTALVKACSLSQ
jgi:hypothetical protein